MNAVLPSGRHPIRWETWALSEEADRRFRYIVVIVGALMVMVGLGISLIHLEGRTRPETSFNSNRYIELLPEQPKPAEVSPKVEEPKPSKQNSTTPPQQAAPVKTPTKPIEKPVVPVPDKTEVAKQIAQKSGILAMQDQLSDLRDPNLNALNNSQPLISGTLDSKGGTMASASGSPDSIAASAAAASGGIGGSGTSSVTSTQSGAGVGTRRTNTVTSPLGFGQTKGGNGHPGPDPNGSRSSKDLQEVFDRNKSAFYNIFQRAQRENPDMSSGKIIVSLTIAPSGAVTECSLVSSTFHDPDLERKIIERVKLMNFGAKNVPVFTYPNYPINYLPN